MSKAAIKASLRRVLTACSFGRIAQSPGSADGACYLTFDDGPHPVHTRALLDLLERHQARATFFLVGSHVEAEPEVAREIAARGHLLGNHSYHHRAFWQLPLARQLEEVETTERLLRQIDGRASHPFRPPQGRLSLSLALALIGRGTRTVLWTRDSLDYRLEPSAIVEHLSVADPDAGDVLLFHDDGPKALQALEVMLPRWRSSGIRFEASPA